MIDYLHCNVCKKKKSSQIHWLFDLSRAFPVKGATQLLCVFFPLTRLLCSLTPVAAHFIALVFFGLPLFPRRDSLLSPSFLVCRISVRALVERDPGGRRFCPARRDLNPSRLPRYPITVVFDTSADNPRAVLGQKRRYTQDAFEEDSWGKNSEAQSGNGLEVAGCHVRCKPFKRCLRYIGTFLHQHNRHILTFSRQYVVTFSRRQVSFTFIARRLNKGIRSIFIGFYVLLPCFVHKLCAIIGLFMLLEWTFLI